MSWGLQVCLSILESYLLLQGAEVLSQHGAAVVETLAALFGAVNERATMMIFPVLDTLLQVRVARLIDSALGLQCGCVARRERSAGGARMVCASVVSCGSLVMVV